MNDFPFLIFDFDGTIIESAVGMTACINEVLSELGRPRLEVHDLENMVGEGIHITVQRALEKTGEVPKELDKYVDHFKKLYHQQPIEKTPLYPNAISTLEKLASNGHVMALCTNKVYDATLRLCKGLNILHYFKAITGGYLPNTETTPRTFITNNWRNRRHSR